MAQQKQEHEQEQQQQPQQTGEPRWLLLAIASGAFAAMNGLFAKLTTDAQTGTLMKFLNANGNPTLELVIRGFFLALNMLSNIINVGALHARPHRIPLHNQSLHYQHVGEFLGYGVAGDACF